MTTTARRPVAADVITCRFCDERITIGFDFAGDEGWIDVTDSRNCPEPHLTTHEPTTAERPDPFLQTRESWVTAVLVLAVLFVTFFALGVCVGMTW